MTEISFCGFLEIKLGIQKTSKNTRELPNGHLLTEQQRKNLFGYGHEHRL